ncbi:MAG: hypothetical protein QG597_3858 [Actinomycetota bacterium]|nr:hypothetical protein [Actinomycetota bacterium]
MNELPRNRILQGDAATVLRRLPEASVDCVVTSPPYFALRDYGHVGQLGLEDTVHGWVEGLRTVCREIGRVLKPSGAFWLNVGDSFSRHEQYGAPPKALLLGPERLAIGLADDGWLVRNRVVWAKSNAMPSSVRDRLTMSWEVLYLLVRSPSYYFDLDAIREPHTTTARPQRTVTQPDGKDIGAGPLAANRGGLAKVKAAGIVGHRLGKNPADVWRMATSSYRGGHFATFPTELVRRPISATCPAKACLTCGKPWQITRPEADGPVGPRCGCGEAAQPRPGVVLDPFFGSGTVGVVAQELGRDWLGVELNPAYIALAQERLYDNQQQAAA